MKGDVWCLKASYHCDVKTGTLLKSFFFFFCVVLAGYSSLNAWIRAKGWGWLFHVFEWKLERNTRPLDKQVGLGSSNWWLIKTCWFWHCFVPKSYISWSNDGFVSWIKALESTNCSWIFSVVSWILKKLYQMMFDHDPTHPMSSLEFGDTLRLLKKLLNIRGIEGGVTSIKFCCLIFKNVSQWERWPRGW